MFRLDRFIEAQDHETAGFEQALAEVQAGRKTSHWIWYVFPQLSGLGSSAASQMFGITDPSEAAAYLHHAVLRRRLLTITEAVLERLQDGVPLQQLMGGQVDARKLVSSMTLFAAVARRAAGQDAKDEFSRQANSSEQILRIAESQGFARCRYTLDRLHEHQL